MTTATADRGVGKCEQNHLGSCTHTPSAPVRTPDALAGPAYDAPVPSDPAEPQAARFCRDCGAPYFGDDPIRD